MAASSGILTDWHQDVPHLYVSISVNDDGTGNLNYTGVTEEGSLEGGDYGAFYQYNLQFLVSNRGDLPSGHLLGSDERNNYNGTHIIQKYGYYYDSNPQWGSVDFNLNDLGVDTSQNIYFYYFCSAYNPDEYDSYGDIPGDTDCGAVWQCGALLKPPSISEVTLRNPKSGSSTISDNPNTISITASRTGGNDYTTWETWIKRPNENGENHTYTSGDRFNNHYDTFNNLSPRTEYVFDAKMSNAAGDSGWAGQRTFRTLSDPPTVTIKSTSKTLNSVTFNYESNYDLNKIYYKYKIANGAWSEEKSQDASGKTGNITIITEPNTIVYIKIYGQENWDNQKAPEPSDESSNCTTYDIGHTTVQSNIIHNNGNIALDTTNPSGNELTFQILDDTDIIFSQIITKELKHITLSEEQWDNIYRRYGNENSKVYKVRLITKADKDHNPSVYSVTDTITITLTGIQKTTHVGETGPKRAMVWYSDNGIMKHAVVWVGANNTTKRTI